MRIIIITFLILGNAGSTSSTVGIQTLSIVGLLSGLHKEGFLEVGLRIRRRRSFVDMSRIGVSKVILYYTILSRAL